MSQLFNQTVYTENWEWPSVYQVNNCMLKKVNKFSFKFIFERLYLHLNQSQIDVTSYINSEVFSSCQYLHSEHYVSEHCSMCSYIYGLSLKEPNKPLSSATITQFPDYKVGKIQPQEQPTKIHFLDRNYISETGLQLLIFIKRTNQINLYWICLTSIFFQSSVFHRVKMS